MIDLEDFDLPDPPAPPGEMGGGVFDQADIDALFGDVGPIARKSGLRAVIESKVISHERLPMLEVVCDRVVRSFA
ncbi:flagellar motor switch protein FliM, partial [Escherichia coli]|nr:flagellar motor switch protein FliM [Escherichia coli]